MTYILSLSIQDRRDRSIYSFIYKYSPTHIYTSTEVLQTAISIVHSTYPFHHQKIKTDMNPIHSPSSVPSQQDSASSSSLPPEAIALAGRLFEAARKGDAQSELLIRMAVERGGERLSNLTNDKGDSLVSSILLSSTLFSCCTFSFAPLFLPEEWFEILEIVYKVERERVKM